MSKILLITDVSAHPESMDTLQARLKSDGHEIVVAQMSELDAFEHATFLKINQPPQPNRPPEPEPELELEMEPENHTGSTAVMVAAWDVTDQSMDVILMYSPTDDTRVLADARRLRAIYTQHQPMFHLTDGKIACQNRADALHQGVRETLSLLPEEQNVLFGHLNAALREAQARRHAHNLSEQLTAMNAELYERTMQVEKELYVARQLQQSLLPPILKDTALCFPAAHENDPPVEPQFTKCHLKTDQLRITGVYLPCDALGGDLYDVVKFPNGTIGVSIADVSGHGVPAGFITAIFKSSFYRITHSHSQPNDILYHLNNELADIVKTGEYVTAVYSRILDEDGQLVFEHSGAGHPYPILYRAADQSVTRLMENGTPLVWVKDMDYPLGRTPLQPGDKILLFTDGVTEMRNGLKGLFGEDALDTLFQELASSKVAEPLLDRLIERLSDFAEGHPLEDDLSVVLIEAV